jgi:hypothetical protein
MKPLNKASVCRLLYSVVVIAYVLIYVKWVGPALDEAYGSHASLLGAFSLAFLVLSLSLLTRSMGCARQANGVSSSNSRN